MITYAYITYNLLMIALGSTSIVDAANGCTWWFFDHFIPFQDVANSVENEGFELKHAANTVEMAPSRPAPKCRK